MQSTKEGYLLTRNVIKVEREKNKVFHFMKVHKVLMIMSALFLALILAEGILITEFIHTLKAL